MNRFKDRDPLDTIDLINNFFIGKGYQVKPAELGETPCGSWTCYVDLFLDDLRVQQSCGKGATKEFALASGYAELFERFCSNIHIYSNPILSKKFVDYNLKTFGYHMDKNEKKMDLNDFLSEPIFQKWGACFTNTKEDLAEYLNVLCNKQIIGLPFKHYNNDKVKYLDPRIFYLIYGSTGLSAGNTFEEAFIQGVSEIFERFANHDFFKTKYDKYYEIENQYLNSVNKTYIEKIENTNKEIRIFDLSYNINLPVCLCLLIDKENYCYYMDFGSAPTFDLAVERILTELYQNILKNQTLWEHYQKPFAEDPWYHNLTMALPSMPRATAVPEYIFYSEIIKTKPSNCFIENAQKLNNLDLYNYITDICKKNNYNPYIYNNSLSSDFYSFNIYIPEIDFVEYKRKDKEAISCELKDSSIYAFKQSAKFLKELVSKGNLFFTAAKFHDFQIMWKNRNQARAVSIIHSGWFQLYGINLNNNEDFSIYFGSSNTFFNGLIKIKNPIVQKELKKYLTAITYLEQYKIGNYTLEQINSIFNSLGIENTENLLRYSSSDWYIFSQVFLKGYIEEFHSERHNKFIESHSNGRI